MTKNFYFVRHGETDHNVKHILHDQTDIALNERGLHQARMIQPVIETLPVQVVCVSPMLRAQQTKKILTQNLSHPEVVIDELQECTGDIWLQFMEYEKEAQKAGLHSSTELFLQRVKSGFERALSHPGPVLIVAHGGVHWALCHMLEVEDHDRKVGNCVPVHFYLTQDGKWKAEVLPHSH